MAEELRTIDWEDALSDDSARKDRDDRRKEDDPLYLINVELGLSRGKVVIAIDISTPLAKRDDLRGFRGVLGLATGFLTGLAVENQIATLRGRDLLVTPDLEGTATLGFPQFGEAIDRGEAAGRAAADRLRELSVCPEEYAAWKASPPPIFPDEGPVTSELRVETGGRIDPDIEPGRGRARPSRLADALPEPRERLRIRRRRDGRLPRGRADGPTSRPSSTSRSTLGSISSSPRASAGTAIRETSSSETSSSDATRAPACSPGSTRATLSERPVRFGPAS